MKKLLLLILIVAAGDSICFADTTDTIFDSPEDTVLYYPEGMGTSAVAVGDSTNYERHLSQNPTMALFKSMFVPGLGQLGNRRYVKAAIVVGLQSWLISSAVSSGRKASDLRDRFEQSGDVSERNNLYDQYLSKKDSRNKYTWFAIIVTFVSMFDAYADAHLSGYPRDRELEKEKIDLSVGPQGRRGIYASVSYSF